MTLFLQNTLDTWQAGGPLLIFIALVSCGIWFYFLRMRSQLLHLASDATQTIRQLEQSPGETAVTRRPTSRTDHLLANAQIDIDAGAPPREALQHHETATLNAIRKNLIILMALTAVAPLLGLLGTVSGMIETFTAVATVTGNTGSRVADGISQALITTQFGLVVALPGVYGITRTQRLARNTEILIAQCRTTYLLNQRMTQDSP